MDQIITSTPGKWEPIPQTPKPPQIFTALLAAQQAMEPLRKDAKNPGFKSNYATLSAVVDVISAPLAAQSLIVLQTVEPRPEGTVLVTRIVHAPTGEEVTSVYPVVCKDLTDPQKFGGAITYARRYSLLALLSLTPEDDDGNAAARPIARQEERPAPTPLRRADTPAAARAVVAAVSTPEEQAEREQLLGSIRAGVASRAWTQTTANATARRIWDRPVAELSAIELVTVLDDLTTSAAAAGA